MVYMHKKRTKKKNTGHTSETEFQFFTKEFSTRFTLGHRPGIATTDSQNFPKNLIYAVSNYATASRMVFSCSTNLSYL